jgi:hypothetical protein
MLDHSQLDTLTQLSGALLLGAFQAYNVYEQKRAKTAASEAKSLAALTFADVQGDLDALRASVESLTVKLQGGDRRTGRAPTSNNIANRRWTDPTTPKPTE